MGQYLQPVPIYMKKNTILRVIFSGLLLFAMLSPTFALGFGDGKKHFKQGMKFESAEEWDKASEEFALAVNENPKNPEYRLHLQRALFNASQMYIKRGTMAAGEKDYEGAYNAFRKAYAFDPTNELARGEMERMVRLQKAKTDPGAADPSVVPGTVKLTPTAYTPQKENQIPQRLEKLRDVPFPAGVDLQFIIKELAKDLDLNVLFDTESRLDSRKVKIELKNVTSARALDYIFLQENLFFQKVGPRTIMVASNNRRNNLQQLVLRTFYLANASPKDIAKVVQSAIPAQPGRSQTIILTDDATNSVTIRDTGENIRIIGRLIQALDKDRAEVVMDVAIYEVNKSDLLQFGNQLGTTGTNGTLTNIGGVGFPTVHAGSSGGITSKLPFLGTDALGIALGLPVSNIVALQTKSNTKLIASTQIHAFNNEDSSARIGQRVPVRTATFQTGNNTGSGVVSDVINYEQVGLTLKFKPLVFPNQDVQVAMEIESKDVSGASTLTPTFTERVIKGTARVQNNKTLLLASVAQGVETQGRSGLPLLGLIPILGRLFTAPTRDNRQVDIVIAVTPRVIRSPAILPEDEVEQPTGSLATPTSGLLEAMIVEEEKEEMLAAARRNPTQVQMQLPDQNADAPAYVRDDAARPIGVTASTVSAPAAAANPLVKPIDSTARTLKLTETADRPSGQSEPVDIYSATLKMDEASPMKAGERQRLAINFSSVAAFRNALVGLKYDGAKLSVRSILLGDAFGIKANSIVTPFINQNGKTNFSLIVPDGIELGSSGVLAYIEIEALEDGVPAISFDRDLLNLMTSDGKNFVIKD